jgi:hypothetical protein
MRVDAMITAYRTYREDCGFVGHSQPGDGTRCQTCGNVVPPGFAVCYGCDLELGIGEWHNRPRRHGFDLGTHCGLKRGRRKKKK